MSMVKTAAEIADEQKAQAINAMLKADGRPPKASPPPPSSREQRAPTSATLWLQANDLFAALRDLSDQCRHTANSLEQNLMEIERMLGQMPKQP